MRVDIELDADQAKAVMTDSAAIVVVAGAGSGKTEVVARRVERLLEATTEATFRVLALSYTVKAADELKERLRERLGDLHRRVDADTVHGFALSLLRQYGTRIGLPREPEVLTRDEDRAELLVSWLEESGLSGASHDVAGVLECIDIARARCEAAPLLTEWRSALESAGALDFAAMVDRATELLEDSWVHRHLQRLYEHVIVDEAQNLSLAQYQLLTRLAGEPMTEHRNLMVVGDDRQSIVGFAGADPRLITRFEREYKAERIELHSNYRSAARITRIGVHVAAALGRPTTRSGSEFAAKGRVQLQEAVDEADEAGLIVHWVEALLTHGLPRDVLAPGESPRVMSDEIAVLARSSASLSYTQTALAVKEIEFAVASTEDDWVRSREAQLLVELVAYRSAPQHRSTRRRIEGLLDLENLRWDDPAQSLATAGYGDLAFALEARDPMELLDRSHLIESEDPDWLDDLSQLHLALGSFLDRSDAGDRTFGNFRQHIARCQRGDALDPGVRLLTIHKAQGREYRAVALVACNEGQIPDFRATSQEDLRSELRTFYVAVSRPSRELLLTRSLTRGTRYGRRATEPSRFLEYVPLDVISSP